jgi:predicted CoA-binding protein
MNSITELLEDPSTSIAVVGATDRSGKYGGIIYRDLKAKGFDVFPVNPHRPSVDGDPAYGSLAELPGRPGIVNYVVPPSQTLRVLDEARRLGLTTAWVQPGAEDDHVLRFLDRHGFSYLTGACIMVASRAVA